MIGTRALRIAVLGGVLSTFTLHAQTAAHYREFQLGSDVATVSALTGIAASDAKTVRSRPAVLQELEWRRPHAFSETVADPVEQIVFGFYNDQLYRLVIDYERDRTDGMTNADMVEAISTMYGPTVKPQSKAARAARPTVDDESGTRVATWGNDEFSAVLYRSSFVSGFRMVVTSVRLDALARTAEAQAIRLDERDAPQRERARQKKQADDERAAKAKARLANKAAFRP